MIKRFTRWHTMGTAIPSASFGSYFSYGEDLFLMNYEDCLIELWGFYGL